MGEFPSNGSVPDGGRIDHWIEAGASGRDRSGEWYAVIPSSSAITGQVASDKDRTWSGPSPL